MDSEKFIRNHRQHLIPLIIIVSSCVFIYVSMPWIDANPIPCIHRTITGIGCPLCGMTHAVNEILHFRLSKAWHDNPAVYFLIIWLIAEGLFLINYSIIMGKVKRIMLYALLGSLAAVYLLRIAHLLN
jgi:hypothetical protein